MVILSQAFPVTRWGWDPNKKPITQIFFTMPDPTKSTYEGLEPGQFAARIPVKLPQYIPAIENGVFKNVFRFKFCDDFPFCYSKKREYVYPGVMFGNITRDDFIVLPDGEGAEKFTRYTKERQTTTPAPAETSGTGRRFAFFPKVIFVPSPPPSRIFPCNCAKRISDASLAYL